MSSIESDPNYIVLGEAAIMERRGKIQEAHDVLAPLVVAGNDGEDFLVLLAILDAQLASDTEPNVRRILDHVGLPWNDQCLRFHESERVVSTASYKQVREPIYTKSVVRWKNYRDHLSPLLDELGAQS